MDSIKATSRHLRREQDADQYRLADDVEHLLGDPDSTGDNWQFGVRPAEVLDAAGVEIIELNGQPFSRT